MKNTKLPEFPRTCHLPYGLTECKSAWADEKIEGIYIRVGEKIITHRFKMVRSDFERNVPQFGSDGKLIKNQAA